MQLATYMAERGLSDDDVAKEISRARATVSRYRRGKLIPDWGVRERIKSFTGGLVTEQDWAEIAKARSSPSLVPEAAE
jgi:ribosome-binding protein aMBF1 (putative translation factor)